MSELLDIVLKTLDDKLGENIVAIDMSSASAFCDWFVIATAKISAIFSRWLNLSNRKRRRMDSTCGCAKAKRTAHGCLWICAT